MPLDELINDLFLPFRLACGLSTLGVFLMWLLWAIIYISQVYPMLQPQYDLIDPSAEK